MLFRAIKIICPFSREIKYSLLKTILLQTINEEKHLSRELAELSSIYVTDFDIDQFSAQLTTLPSLMIFDNT